MKVTAKIDTVLKSSIANCKQRTLLTKDDSVEIVGYGQAVLGYVWMSLPDGRTVYGYSSHLEFSEPMPLASPYILGKAHDAWLSTSVNNCNK